MRILFAIAILVSLDASSYAGDGIGGTNRYEADFSREHVSHKMSKKDEQWDASLLRKLKYDGKVVYFVRTNLPLQKDGTNVIGLIYRRIDQPQHYYIAEGDVMLNLKDGLIFNPGVGGFSMHSPKSRNFIACLNFQQGGVPFVHHSEIKTEGFATLAEGQKVTFEVGKGKKGPCAVNVIPG